MRAEGLSDVIIDIECLFDRIGLILIHLVHGGDLGRLEKVEEGILLLFLDDGTDGPSILS